jgi:hypothetical protein
MSWQGEYRRWAVAWLDGSDRTTESACRAANSPASSAYRLAGWGAYWAAYSVAYSASRTAAHSVEYSARFTSIDLAALAKEAIT